MILVFGESAANVTALIQQPKAPDFLLKDDREVKDFLENIDIEYDIASTGSNPYLHRA